MYIGRGWGHNVNSAQDPITPWASPGAVQRTYLQLLWQLMKWPLEAPQTPKKHLITFLAFFSKFPSLLCKCMASVSPPPTAEHCFPFSHDAAALLIWRWMQFASTSRNSITGTKKPLSNLNLIFCYLVSNQIMDHLFMQTLPNLTLSACYRGYEPQKQTTESVAGKQREEFSLLDSQSVCSSLPPRHEAQSESKSMFFGCSTVKLCLVMACKLIDVLHPLVYIYSTIRWLHISHVLHWKKSSNGEMKSSKGVLL